MATDQKTNKKKTLLILIPAVLLLLIIGVAKIVAAKKSTNNSVKDNKTQSFIDPDLDYSSDTIKHKTDVYKLGDQKVEEEEEVKKKSSINMEELSNMANEPKKQDGDVGFQNLDNNSQSANPKEKRNESKQVSQGNSQLKPKVIYRDRPVSNVQQIEPVKKSEPVIRGGMGVYVSSTNSGKDEKNDQNNDLQSDEEKYLPAVLEEDTKVKNNTDLIFILNRDSYIKNVKFKKNSVIYAKAVNGNNAFDVVAYTIRNAADNKKYSVRLVLYNENLSRGIRYEGNLGNAVKQGQMDAVDDYSYTMQGTNAATQAGSNLVRGTVRSLQRPQEVSIRQGYRVNFKITEDGQ